MKRTITLITLIAALLVPSMALAQRMPAKANMRLSQFKKPANILLRDGEEPIMDSPEGILHDNMYASSFAYGLGWGDIYIQDVDGGIGKVVEGTDGNLYIYNPISQGYIWFSILPWIKAEPAGDGKYVVKLPQLYILDYGDPYYAYCMHYDEDEGMPVVEEEGEIEFTWQDGVLTQLGDKFIGLCDATADWFYMADQHIVYGCISMPSNVFATTGTNVSVLFFDNSRKADKVVLIDASKLGEEYKDGNNQRKRLRDFEIQKIVDTFLDQKAEDGFSVVVSHDEIKAKGYTLSAGQYFDVKIEYVPITAAEFAEKIAGFKSRLSELNAKGAELDREIARNLDSLSFVGQEGA